MNKIDNRFTNLHLVCDGIQKLTYTELKMLVSEIDTQIKCWEGDLSSLNDIIVDAARELQNDLES